MRLSELESEEILNGDLYPPMKVECVSLKSKTSFVTTVKKSQRILKDWRGDLRNVGF